MVVELAHTVVLWLNNFPPTGGISDVISPRQLVYGTKLDMTKHCHIEFRAYAQIYTGPTPTNTLTERTEAGICLGPVDNVQGSIKFLVLRSGKIVIRRPSTLTAEESKNVLRSIVLTKLKNTGECKT